MALNAIVSPFVGVATSTLAAGGSAGLSVTYVSIVSPLSCGDVAYRLKIKHSRRGKAPQQ
jgi:hypothetical protein